MSEVAGIEVGGADAGNGECLFFRAMKYNG